MGAWGYGYRDNDNYFNLAGEFIEPLVDALVLAAEERGDLQDLRARFMWTINTLRSTNEEVTISENSLQTLRTLTDLVLSACRDSAKDWSEPDKFVYTVEDELKEVKAWLSGFQEVGFLEDRLSAIMVAGKIEDCPVDKDGQFVCPSVCWGCE